MAVGADHQVSAGVGEAVHHDGAGWPAPENAIFRVVGLVEHFAKETGPVFRAEDVFDSPGRPDIAHRMLWGGRAGLTWLVISGSLVPLYTVSR